METKTSRPKQNKLLPVLVYWTKISSSLVCVCYFHLVSQTNNLKLSFGGGTQKSRYVLCRIFFIISSVFVNQ